MNFETTDRIRFILNGQDIALANISQHLTLLDWLRLERGLTGSKEGCCEGDCGACSVLVGRLEGGQLVYEAVNACIRFMGSLNATHIVTIEHLASPEGALHPVQQSMVEYHGSQCGFCTPGFVMSLYALWLADENPDRGAIERALQGNLCRCTGYEPIIKAAQAISLARPDALFDPLLRERQSVTSRLAAIHTLTTIHIESGEGELFVPGSLGDLAEILGHHPGATLAAGCTDVGLWVTKQLREITPVIFIHHLEALQKIAIHDDGVMLGAGVTYTQARETFAQTHPPLANLIDRIGGAQVRNMGTIGGNIANGSPIGDMPPALIVLGSVVHLRSREGVREVPLEEFFIDYGRQDRERHEFIESIFVPFLGADEHFAIYKISKRFDEDISTLCGAFRVVLYEDGPDGDSFVKSARIAFGGMAGTPKRGTHCEAALLKKPWNEETIDLAREALVKDFTPLSDWRASADYRMVTAKNLLTRFFLETGGQSVQLTRFEGPSHE